MGGGSKSGGSTTTVQKADPWIGVQPYLGQAYQQAGQLYGSGQAPQYYPGQTIASPNYWEGWGQDQQLQNLSGLSQLGAAGQQGVNQMIGTGGTAGLQGVTGALDSMNQLGQVSGSMFEQGTGLSGAGINQMSGAMNTLNDVAGSMYQQGTDLYAGGRGGAMQGMNQLLGAGDVMNNPYLAGAMQAAIRPVQEQFTEQVMPGIKQGAMGAGQMGGSRQGVAEGIASRGYLDTISDLTARMGSQAYGQGLQAVQAGAGIGQGLAGQGLQQYGMGIGATGQAGQFGQGMLGAGQNLYGLGMQGVGAAGGLGSNIFGTGMESLGRGTALTPTAQQGLLSAGMAGEQVGQQRTADQQQQIDAAMQRWNYEQQLPYSMVSDYLSMLQGAPGGMTSSSMQGGGGSSLMSGLGGAATGYGLGGALGTALGIANPWFGIGGALLGGGLGLFG